MESSTILTADPIVKWAGGKRAIKEKIKQYFPKDFQTYIEPFCGGAAIALSMGLDNVVINDINADLINVYLYLKDSMKYKYLMYYLEYWQSNNNYLSEKFYYRLRTAYNKHNDKLVNAAQFIALNKLGYNGLFRVNSKGEFNVPWGKRSASTKIYEPEKIEAIHKKLQTIQIYNKNYWELDYKARDFVYLDPPYDTDKQNFTSYNSGVFSKIEQANLSVFCSFLTNDGVRFCQSNADTEFIRELYKDFNIYEIEAPRRIACNGDRTKAKEVLITNYV
jgi:DNA adenine methylase